MEQKAKDGLKIVYAAMNEAEDQLHDAMINYNNANQRLSRILAGHFDPEGDEIEYKHLCQYCQNKVSELEYVMNNFGNKFIFHVCSNKCWAILRVVLEMQGYKFSERDQQIYEGKA